ncbi:hypothetical protein [Vulcanisaeta sp. JCM 16161]|uniref:hypothetical protein n=1 Tax=Vulcanisaeta sp. JCM 16161 TaxID=1295372 RepID=UPI000A9C9D8E|nr:hypothetical protein [Vulcanisaeta sp. JCM 16161]
MSCSVYLDRSSFSSGEPIYITLVNLGNAPLRIGSWQVVDLSGRVIYSIELLRLSSAQIPPSLLFGFRLIMMVSLSVGVGIGLFGGL